MNKVIHSLLTSDLININDVGTVNEFKFKFNFNLRCNVSVLAASNTALSHTLNIDDIKLLSSFKTLEI